MTLEEAKNLPCMHGKDIKHLSAAQQVNIMSNREQLKRSPDGLKCKWPGGGIDCHKFDFDNQIIRIRETGINKFFYFLVKMDSKPDNISDDEYVPEIDLIVMSEPISDLTFEKSFSNKLDLIQ